jgi:glycine hydroxymethyltransferase
MAAYFALLEPGDTVLGMDLAHGGHLTHGAKVSFSGRLYPFHALWGRSPHRHHRLRRSPPHRPRRAPQTDRGRRQRLSAHSRFRPFADIAAEVGAYLMVDMAHIAGLVAVGLHPPRCRTPISSPPRRTRRCAGRAAGSSCPRAEHADKLRSEVFPGIQGGPLMHVIAAKAVAFKEALAPEFKHYQERVLVNAQTLAEELQSAGLQLVSGGTDNHLMLVDLTILGHHRQSRRSGPRCGRYHRQQECGALRPSRPAGHQRCAHRHALCHQPRHGTGGDAPDSGHDRRCAQTSG